MRKLKVILIAIAGLIVLLLIIAAFLPSSYTVQRSEVIGNTAKNILPHIINLRNWEKWSPWREMDSLARYDYNDTTGAGAVMSWDGKIIGSGKLRISSVAETKAGYDLHFFTPFESVSTGEFTLEQSDKETKVTWMNTGTLNYPVGRLMFLFMNFDKMMGPDFEKGLGKLKKIAETSYNYTYEIREKQVESFPVAVIRNKVGVQDIEKTIGASYKAIHEFIGKNGAACSGSPMAITIAFDSTSWDFEAAVPINKEIKGNDKIQVKKSYSGKTIFLKYTGPYDKTMVAYDELHHYLAENKLEENGGPWEVYITDPGAEPDPNKWVTEIYFPVK